MGTKIGAKIAHCAEAGGSGNGVGAVDDGGPGDDVAGGEGAPNFNIGPVCFLCVGDPENGLAAVDRPERDIRGLRISNASPIVIET